MKRYVFALITLAAVAVVAAFGLAGAQNLKGSIKIDGSSTVGPISMAVAEEFMAEYPDVRVTVGISGTGGGFKKFVAGETDISDASRPVKQEELDKAKAAGINVIELPVAFDGLAVLVNKNNTWVDHLTVAELSKSATAFPTSPSSYTPLEPIAVLLSISPRPSWVKPRPSAPTAPR